MPKFVPIFDIFCNSAIGLEFETTDSTSAWLVTPIELLQEDSSASSEATKR